MYHPLYVDYKIRKAVLLKLLVASFAVGTLLIVACAVLTLQPAPEPTPWAAPRRSTPNGRTFVNQYPRFDHYVDGGDPGQPLILTPYINNNSYTKDQVRKMALVSNNSIFHGITSYAGYLTVDPQFNSNMFFWYFPAENGSEFKPTLLWLQGGPGASSLFGLFTENGPLELVDNGKLKLRIYSWHKFANLVYIDNPVGTGFSFTNEGGYARDESAVAHNLHKAVMQLYQLFEWDKSGFWITGESYAGKYVPALARHIHRTNKDAPVFVPIKGVAIGNGLSDPIHQLQYGEYLYNLGMLDEHGLKMFDEAQARGIKCIEHNDMSCAFEVFDSLINSDFSGGSLFQNLTGLSSYYNYVRDGDNNLGSLGDFLQSSEVRRAIHVGNQTFHDVDKVNVVEQHLKEDVMRSVAPWISELLDVMKVCVYNGQLDIIVAYPLTRNYLNKLKFNGDAIYRAAERHVWHVDKEVAGYIKKGGNLMDVMVRNAGHMVPHDQPKWAYDLISHFVAD